MTNTPARSSIDRGIISSPPLFTRSAKRSVSGLPHRSLFQSFGTARAEARGKPRASPTALRLAVRRGGAAHRRDTYDSKRTCSQNGRNHASGHNLQPDGRVSIRVDGLLQCFGVRVDGNWVRRKAWWVTQAFAAKRF